MQPRVAIVYLCYGNLRHLPEVVESFAAQTYPKDRTTVFMVPNASPDGIADVIRREVLPRSGKDLPEIILHDDGENRGFAGGNNVVMQRAIDEGFDYIFLNNGDLKLDAHAIEELVTRAESDTSIGSVQSLVLYWHEPGKINASGGMFHIAGYGYARHNLEQVVDTSLVDGEEIAFSSGAAVLYRTSALKKVGLLEEGFFMYHEDLELGLRLRFAGYKNVLSTRSCAFHDYSFSRNPKKFAWTELYRWVVMLSYYKWQTLFLMLPLLLTIELGTWVMAAKGGWLRAKWWAYLEAVKPRTWRLVKNVRSRAQRLRVIRDADLLTFTVGKIEAQEQHNWVVEHVANPAVDACLRRLKRLVTW